MPNRIEAGHAKAPPTATGRLKPLRLFSTLLAIALIEPVKGEWKAQSCTNGHSDNSR
jgi:hypothetical protein